MNIQQEGELSQADKYAEVALQADRYNPSGQWIILTSNIYFYINLVTLASNSLACDLIHLVSELF